MLLVCLVIVCEHVITFFIFKLHKKHIISILAEVFSWHTEAEPKNRCL